MANFSTTLVSTTLAVGTEFSVAKNANFNSSTPDTTTCYVSVRIDFTAVVAGDTVQVRVYHGVNGGTLTADDVATISPGTIWKQQVGLVDGNWDITVKQTAGTGRAIKASVVRDTNDVNAATISNGAIAAATFAANAITSSVIAASAIGASQIASAAITATKFATDAIDGNVLAAAAVTEIQNGLALAGDVTAILAAVASRAPLTDTTTLLSRLSAIRAGLLDNLDIASSSIAAASASAVWATISEGTETVLQALRLIVARATGDGGVQNGDGLYVWKSQDGSKTRVGMLRTGNSITRVTRDGT